MRFSFLLAALLATTPAEGPETKKLVGELTK